MSERVLPHAELYKEGFDSFYLGTERELNFYLVGSDQWFAWDRGWCDAHENWRKFPND